MACGSHTLGDGALFAIAGPDVLESSELAVTTARALSEAATRLGIALVFKSSYLKANRSSHDAYVGPGLERGLQILAEVKRETGLPILTDVHSIEEVEPAAEVADVLQIPAFLSRQTFLIRAATETGHPEPDRALCDAASQWPLAEFEPLMEQLLAIHAAAAAGAGTGRS